MVIPDDKTNPVYLEAGDALPPAYTQTVSATSTQTQDVPPIPPPPTASSSSSSSSASLSPATNFLSIFRANSSVKGSYTINPSMQMPSTVVPPVDANGRKLNLRLGSQNGAIDATVHIIRGHEVKGPALLEAESKNGSVTVTVYDKTQHNFRLHATSDNGAVTLRIPSHFTGPISTQLANGRLTFSPGVHARLTTFSEHGHNGRFFVGDFAASGFEDEDEWLGSAIRVKAQNGRVKIVWADEVEPEKKGFFTRLFPS